MKYVTMKEVLQYYGEMGIGRVLSVDDVNDVMKLSLEKALEHTTKKIKRRVDEKFFTYSSSEFEAVMPQKTY